MYLFNVRVYGILVDEHGRVLISDERTQNVAFTKFPGGGLEYGEGLIDALKREFWEECRLDIDIIKHIYTTDFFEKSSFNNSQILSIYYQVKALNTFGMNLKDKPFDFDPEILTEKQEVFRFIDSQSLKQSDLTFKTDQAAWSAFQEIKNIK